MQQRLKRFDVHQTDQVPASESHRWLRKLAHWGEEFRVWNRKRHTFQQLSKLDDHLLDDLGVSRERGDHAHLHARFAETRRQDLSG